MTASKRLPRLLPEINVTPLVDVVLVLLIIFMVIAPQLEAGERVELPSVAHPAQKAQLDALTVTVTAAGGYRLEREVVAESELRERLRTAHEADPSKKLVLKADRGVRYGVMRQLFSSAQELGFRGVALVVDEKKQGNAVQ